MGPRKLLIAMNYHDLIHSPLIPREVAALAQKAGRSRVPVLILGERGTGKDLIARVIHYAGDSGASRFLLLDCRFTTGESFITQLDELVKELRYETSVSTLYLKEIGFLEQKSQLKLLEWVEDRFVQNGTQVSGGKNVRLIASTSENLQEKVALGKFLEDLYHGVNTFRITVPALRDRPDDVGPIARFVLDQYSKRMKIHPVEIPDSVMNLLRGYWWPGNLKELEHVMIRSAVLSNGGHLTERDIMFESRNGVSVSGPFTAEQGTRRSATADDEDQNSYSLSTLLIELVHRIKNPLVSIKTFTQLLKEKFDDPEFKNSFHQVVINDIEKIDSVLNGLLNYVKIINPLEKTGTVHAVLEEVLKKYQVSFHQKGIKIFKKYEKDLPETAVRDEQLRYIFDSLLQYMIPSILENGSIGLLTKSRSDFRQDRASIQILFVFTGKKRPAGQLEKTLGIPGAAHEDKAIELELRLVQELIQKIRGNIRFEVNEKKPRTLISVDLPVERRKILYYPPKEQN